MDRAPGAGGDLPEALVLLSARLHGDPAVSTLFELLSHLSATTPYLYASSCVYLIARSALACMRLAAAVIAIAARDKKPRAARALEVLRVLSRDHQPPGAGAP